VAEMCMTSLTNLSLTDFSSGLGGLDQAKGAALEQMVIDSDVWESIRGLRKDVSFDEDHFAVDLIEKVGPGGTFLSEPHTLRNMRKELFIPDTEKAALYDSYSFNVGNKDIVERAKGRVRSILAEHRPEPLDGDVDKAIDAIMAEYA
jgi:trimethylamine--corrinoid protein Co-methyltransferase